MILFFRKKVSKNLVAQKTPFGFRAFLNIRFAHGESDRCLSAFCSFGRKKQALDRSNSFVRHDFT